MSRLGDSGGRWYRCRNPGYARLLPYPRTSRDECDNAKKYNFKLTSWGSSPISGSQRGETRNAAGVGKAIAAPPLLTRTCDSRKCGRVQWMMWNPQDPLITDAVEIAGLLDFSLQAKFYGQAVSPTIL